MFNVGDRVEHWCGPDGYGGNELRYGCQGTIVGKSSQNCWSVRMDHDGEVGPWTEKHLRLVLSDYDPTQMGDTEDDI